MKVDRRNPRHWLYLALFGLNVLLTFAARLLVSRHKPGKYVVLYGHKLNGNLLALYRELDERCPQVERVTFLTMDPAYHRELSVRGTRSCLAISPRCIALLARADAVVSDHGLHVMSLLLGRSDLKFFDVWHGIPFKGFDADDFRVQHRFDEVWVASPLMKQFYVERYGFSPEQVQVTGYARTDQLVSARPEARAAIKQRLGLGSANDERFVLFAPTWKQDAADRSLYPFGMTEREFLSVLAGLCQRHAARLLVRHHLNARLSDGSCLDGVTYLPYAQYPDAEEILQISDLLICDWSSIAFDYLLLDRPTVFLDVEPPFSKGFSLDASYRFGPVVSGMDELLHRVEQGLARPEQYQREFGGRHAGVRAEVYGEIADGAASARCRDRLCQQLSPARATA